MRIIEWLKGTIVKDIDDGTIQEENFVNRIQRLETTFNRIGDAKDVLDIINIAKTRDKTRDNNVQPSK